MEVYIEESGLIDKTIFVEVKRLTRGQWVFDLDLEDQSFFDHDRLKKTQIYNTLVEDGYQKAYLKYRNCLNREYSDLSNE